MGKVKQEQEETLQVVGEPMAEYASMPLDATTSQSVSLNVNLNYEQILNLVRQLPIRTRLKLGKALIKEATKVELQHFLDVFRTDEITEEDILESEAHYLVTGDKDLLVVKDIKTCQIIDIPTFESLLK